MHSWVRSLAQGARWLLWVAVVLAACSDRPPSLPRLSPDAVILAFGDSLTYGSGAELAQSYPAVLERLARRKVINAGAPGEVSAEGLKRLPELLDQFRPQLLILIHGGNDLLRKHDGARVAENLRAMVQEARRREVAVVLVGVPEPGLMISVPAFYGRIAAEFRLPYEPDVLAHIESDRSLKSDPIHPNAEGYRLLAQRIFSLLRSAGAV